MLRAFLATLILLSAQATTFAVAQSFVDSDLDGSTGMPRQKPPNRRGPLSTASQRQDGYTIPLVLHQKDSFGVAGPRKTGGSRSGRTANDSILDRGICIGC